MQNISLNKVTNKDLVERLISSEKIEKQQAAYSFVLLAEVNERRVYIDLGFTSLFQILFEIALPF
jgi:hypothetical protein